MSQLTQKKQYSSHGLNRGISVENFHKANIYTYIFVDKFQKKIFFSITKKIKTRKNKKTGGKLCSNFLE